jgi:hypothetical protein
MVMGGGFHGWILKQVQDDEQGRGHVQSCHLVCILANLQIGEQIA